MPGNTSDARPECKGNSLRNVIARRCCLLAALLASLAVAGCGGGSGDATAQATTDASSGTPKASRGPPSTEGSGVTFPLATAPPPPATTTLPPEGLPEHHPVPANGVLTLGGSSTWQQSLTVRGVPIAEVHDWFVGGVIDGGYTVVEDRPRHVEFSGDAVFGVADMTKHRGAVEIAFVLGSPPG